MGARVAKFKSFARNSTTTIKSIDKMLEEKIISPRHPTTVKAFDDLVKSHPEFEESAKQKNENLHKMLDSVRVDSTGSPPTEILKAGKRARKLNVIPDGKLSNDHISQLFLNKKMDPDLWGVEKTAEDFKLDIGVAKNLLQYYSSFHIYKNKKEAITVGSGKTFLQPDEEPELK